MSEKSLIDIFQKRPFVRILLAGSLVVASAVPFVSQYIKKTNPDRVNKALEKHDILSMYWQIKIAKITKAQFADIYAGKNKIVSRLKSDAQYQSILDFGDAVTGFLKTGTDSSSVMQGSNLIKTEALIRSYEGKQFEVVPFAVLSEQEREPDQYLYSQTELNLNPLECEAVQPFFADGRDDDLFQAAAGQAEEQFHIEETAKPEFRRQIALALQKYQDGLKRQCALEEFIIHHGVGTNPMVGLAVEERNKTVIQAAQEFEDTAKVAADRIGSPTLVLPMPQPTSDQFKPQP